MKKAAVILLVFIVLLSGCAKKEMPDMSVHNYKIAMEALEVVDRYLDAELMMDEANELLKGFADNMEDVTTDAELASEHIITFFADTFKSISEGYADDSRVLSLRNILATALNEKERE